MSKSLGGGVGAGSKTAMLRLQVIDQYLRRRGGMKAMEVAVEFRVSWRTLMRDMDFLREQLHAPVVYDRAEECWRYTDATWNLPSSIGAPEHLAAMLMGLQALKGSQVKTLSRRIQKSLDQSALPTEDGMEALMNRFAYRFRAARPVDEDILEGLTKALLYRRKCRIAYGRSGAEIGTRVLMPHLLVNIESQWYLFAKSRAADPLDQLLVARIRRLEVLEETFRMPASFKADDVLYNSFGRYVHGREERLKTAVILFDDDLRDYVEGNIWHPEQRTSTEPDGQVRLELPYVNHDDLYFWVMGFGEGAEVVEPAELRRDVVAGIEKMRARYGPA